MINSNANDQTTTRIYKQDLLALQQLKQALGVATLADTITHLLDQQQGRATSQVVSLKITSEAGNHQVEVVKK